MGMSKEERERREASKRAFDEAKERGDSFALAPLKEQQNLDEVNAIDERMPNRRPSTIVNVDTQEPAPDERQFAGDEAKALNEMTGRAAQTWNMEPAPGPEAVLPKSLEQPPSDSEEDVLLLRGYQPGGAGGGPSGDKAKPGNIVRVSRAEARRLINSGAAKFAER
jgi:hypothetical protein